MQRGVRREEIFREEIDYQIFLMLLKDSIESCGGKLHAFCLMTNHYHLLLETGETEIWKQMKNLAHKYAMNFNSRYSLRGHLFEGRYKACLVSKDDYFIQTSRYIHLNPVKAHIVNTPEEYKWSSYRTIMGLDDDGITNTYHTLAYFGSKGKIAYKSFVEDAGRKYYVEEERIQTEMGEDEQWLPW